MYTTNIILAMLLIVLMAAAVLLIIRYMRLNTEVKVKTQALDDREKALQKRHNALDRWNTDLKAEARSLAEWEERRKHIYANVEVLDSEEDVPTEKAIGKSLSSKIGYALRKQFPDIQIRHDDNKGGRTVYSIDFYVMPFES